MDIKEIALKLQATDRFRLNVSELSAIEFAEALIAEIAKQNEPVAFLHEWIEYHPFGDTFAGEPCAAITNDEKPFDSSDTVSPLFTFPPDKAQIEQETAWQPIETAPKDGSWVLGWRQHATRPRLIQFDTDYEEWANEDGEHVYSTTHWMPLPTPPKRSM